MFYRARISLAFPQQKQAEKAIEKALDVLPFAVNLNATLPNAEIGYIIVEKCYHDEDPPKPCEIITEHHPA